MVVCPSCGQENPEGFRFCWACGAVFGDVVVTRQERKVVTVLFCDLVGSTAQGERLDPEDLEALLSRYHGRVRNELERFGGTVEKFIGDAVVALFGVPAAHEDDPERAVRAALAVKEWVVQQPDLQVRMAVNTGEAVVSLGARAASGEHVASGDVLNTTARLQAAAPVDGILVGEQTYRATQRAIEYREHEPVLAKGKSEPVRVWEVVQARSRFGIDVEQAPRAALVGRERELRLLHEALERAREEREPQLVTLVGVPGIGKSRVVYELSRIADADSDLVTWRQGRCLPYGEGVTFWALGEMVKAQAGILESDAAEAVEAKLAGCVAGLLAAADSAWVLRSLRPLVGSSGEDRSHGARAEAFPAWRRFLEAIAERGPTVLVFEDLHWADEGLLDFLDELAESTSGVPLLVVCTARPELLAERPGWGGGRTNALTLSLPPLTGDETAQLVHGLLERARLPGQLQQALLERAGGVPLFAEEFARMVGERGTTGLSVPESVQGIIAARLDALRAEDKRLLQDAAVVGKVFWVGAVATISGTARDDLDRGLRELVRRELVRRERQSSVEGESEYAFRHELIREVAYAQIPRSERSDRHRRTAGWIGSLGRPEDHAELLAHHYVQALELSRVVGEDTSELAAKASHFLILAGDRAMQLDITTAERFYRRALELVGRDEEQRAPAVLGLAAAAFEAGNFDEAIRSYKEVIAVLRSLDDPLRLGQALASYGTALFRRGASPQARIAVLTEAVEVLERLPAGPELAFAYASLAAQDMFAGHPEECIEWCEKAIELCKTLGLDREAVRPLHIRGMVRYTANDVGGLDDLRRSLQLGLDLGTGMDAAAAYVNLGEALSWAEGPKPGLARFEEGIQFCGRRGLDRIANVLRMHALRPLFDLGRWDELTAVADELAEQQGRGNRWIPTVALTEKANVLVRRGAVTGARALVEAFLEPAREIQDVQTLAPALVCAALVEQAEGNADAARRRVEEFGAATSDAGPIWRALWIADAARVCAATDALALAKKLTRELEVVAPRARYGLTSARAVLAEAEGKLEEALTEYGEAADRWHQFGNLVEEGYARFGLGRCLIRLERDDEAKESLAAARRMFESLQAGPLITAVDECLTQTTPAAR